MSRFQEVKARVLSERSAGAQGKETNLLAPGDEIEVLRMDGVGNPALVTGRYQGLVAPVGGGPSCVLVTASTGEISIHTDDIVGITPLEVTA